MKIFYLKIWILKDTWNFEKDFFFFFFGGWGGFTKSTQFDWVDSALDEFKCVGPNFWPPTSLSFSLPFCFIFHQLFLPPLALFTFFFPLIFLLYFTISSYKKHFSKFLNSPSSISINISLCFEHFRPTPILVKPIFKNPFSLHQNGFSLQGIFFSSISC